MRAEDDRLEDKVRDAMVKQLRQNLARCRRIILDESLDLKTRERWTQLYTNTSKALNTILKDRQMRDWERRLREIEGYEQEEALVAAKNTRKTDSRKVGESST